MLLRSLPWLAVVLLLTAPLRAAALIIDFETTPDGSTPTDEMELLPTDVYTDGDVQVSFSLTVDGAPQNPRFEGVGPPGFTDSPEFTADPREFGFVNTELRELDTADPGFEAQLGDWFLKQPEFDAEGAPVLTITYESVGDPVTEASGEIWDIDAVDELLEFEQWMVEAFDADDNSLAVLISPSGLHPSNPDTLDSRPWLFRFTDLELAPGQGIRKIEISFIGNRPSQIGLAFNNYSPTVAQSAPEPATLSLLGGALLLGVASRKRR